MGYTIQKTNEQYEQLYWTGNYFSRHEHKARVLTRHEALSTLRRLLRVEYRCDVQYEIVDSYNNSIVIF